MHDCIINVFINLRYSYPISNICLETKLLTLSSKVYFLVVFLLRKKLPYVVTRDVCSSVRLSVRLSVRPSVRLSVVCGNIFGTRLHDN